MRALLFHSVIAVVILSFTRPVDGQFFGPWVAAVANSASYAESGQGGYGIARGSLFVVFGQNLGPGQLQQAQSFPLPPSLAGTSVEITMGGTSWNAIMIYTLWDQVAAILPSGVPAGSGTLTVTYDQVSSYPVPITVVDSAFGTYSATSNGIGAGIITRANYQLASSANPVNSGDILIIWGTGLGPVDGDEAAGPLPGNQFPGTEVFVGNQPATVQYAGRSGCCAALDQIVFQVPSSAPLGCFVPVAVRSGGVVSNFTTIPIGAPGKACSDRVGVPAGLITKIEGGQAVTFGVVGIGPIPLLQSAGFSFLQGLSEGLSRLLHVKVSQQDVKRLMAAHGSRRVRLLKALFRKYLRGSKAHKIDTDAVIRLAQSFNDFGAAAGFTQLNGLNSVAAQFGSILPPAGACTIAKPWPFMSQQWGVTSRARDAGAQLVLSGPLGTRSLSEISNGEYQAGLAIGLAGTELPAGAYTISATGGATVGPFTASLISGALQWTNKDTIQVVDRSRPLTVTWDGTNPTGYVLFGGASSSGGDGTAFTCVEDATKQTLTVPQFILNAMPTATVDHGYLFLAMHPLQNPFSATGIDAGYFIDFSSDSKQLGYQ
ncbi:MAG TPA: hypothetical protein VMI94_01510 [Bryobacteraceae bacterium]|nr:hypothetical protein [Bryobacteraceae bacterium]